MRTPISALTMVWILGGCSAANERQPASEAPEATEPAVGSEAKVAGEGEGAVGAPEQGPRPPAGRLAFVQCEGERNPICTKEYRPVCGEVETGIRCVTTPCNSSEQREFGNACMACAEPKTTGYWPVACAELAGRAATP
jgi:hypothetical protein